MEQFNRSKLAFSLIELSALIVVVAMAMSTILAVSQGTTEREAQTNAVDRRAEIVAAINDYLDRNGRYPCVAGYTDAPSTATFGREIMADCTASIATPLGTSRIETAPSSGVFIRVGAVPTFDLLLPDRYMNDGFGNRYTYIVMEGLTKASTYAATTAAITVLDGAGASLTTTAAYAVLSHGKDGKGAYRVESGALKVACGATTNLDVENCDGDASLRLAEFDATTTTAALYNDDFLQFEPKGTPGAAGGSPSSPAPSPDFTGFRLDGFTNSGYAGLSVATGDINGDTLQDVIVGGYGPGVFIFFGDETGIDSPISINTVNGTNGFRFDISAGGDFGRAVSSGDVNGDGFDDVIVSAYWQNYNSNETSGTTWILFGKASGWAATVTRAEVSNANGALGFQLGGIAVGDFSGYSVSSGDINGDTYDDVIISAPMAPGGLNSGHVYVFFGKASFTGTPDIALSTLNGTNGFRLDGSSNDDYAGLSVSSGNINNDTYDDIIIGAYGADNGGSNSGSTYVVFGKAGAWAASTSLSSLNGTTGFRWDGAAVDGFVGYPVSSGDINGDAYDDVIIGGSGADNNGTTDSGSTYVVFGKAGAWAASTSLSTLNGTTGFRIDGFSYEGSMPSALAAGDINGDGFDEIMTSSFYQFGGTGNTYVMFGKASGWSATYHFNESTLPNGTDAFKFSGVALQDYSGYSLALGDITGDGKADMLVGAYGTDYGGPRAGSVYGIYGKSGAWSTNNNLDTITVP